MQDIREALHRCNTGDHELIEASRHSFGEEEYVIRWCKVCGAIVGDIEYDGRVQAGQQFKMMGPQALKLVQLYYEG